MGRYSIKPGRGPAAFGAVGGIIMAAFGLLWTILTATFMTNAPFPLVVRIIFPLFGVLFIVAAVAGAFYNAHNATQSNRFSQLDIVPTDAEPDPLSPASDAASQDRADQFCSKCGKSLRASDNFCSKCGARVIQ